MRRSRFIRRDDHTYTGQPEPRAHGRQPLRLDCLRKPVAAASRGSRLSLAFHASGAALGCVPKVISSFLSLRFGAPLARQTGVTKKRGWAGWIFTQGGGLPPSPGSRLCSDASARQVGAASGGLALGYLRAAPPGRPNGEKRMHPTRRCRIGFLEFRWFLPLTHSGQVLGLVHGYGVEGKWLLSR